MIESTPRMRAASTCQQQLQTNNPPPVVTPVPEEDVADIVETAVVGGSGWGDPAAWAGGTDGAGGTGEGVEWFTAAARRKAEMMLRMRQSTLSGRERDR